MFCQRYGIAVDPARFPGAVIAASSIHDDHNHVYDAEIFVRYTRRIIEEMGGTGETARCVCAGDLSEWAACQHFFLYDDVAPALRALATRGLKIGLISNSHRCLASFERHFSLQGLIAAAISSSEHGYLKPHPSIFESALKLAGVSAHESVMVGDSYPHDVEGAMHHRHARHPGSAHVTNVGNGIADAPSFAIFRNCRHSSPDRNDPTVRLKPDTTYRPGLPDTTLTCPASTSTASGTAHQEMLYKYSPLNSCS